MPIFFVCHLGHMIKDAGVFEAFELEPPYNKPIRVLGLLDFELESSPLF